MKYLASREWPNSDWRTDMQFPDAVWYEGEWRGEMVTVGPWSTLQSYRALAVEHVSRVLQRHEVYTAGRDLPEVRGGQMTVKPLSIAHAAFALCHSAMFRQLGIRRASQFGYRGGWPNDRSEATTRARLGLSEDDLYIPEMFNHDPLALNPSAWLDNAVAQIEQEDE